MKVKHEDLQLEKARIKQEISQCEKCKFEKQLGFGCCDYHKNIIKYLMSEMEVGE